MAKNPHVFTSEAKILGVKMKTGPDRVYGRPPGNKLEITLEVELPWPIPSNTYKQWLVDYRDGAPVRLLDRLADIDDALNHAGLYMALGGQMVRITRETVATARRGFPTSSWCAATGRATWGAGGSSLRS